MSKVIDLESRRNAPKSPDKDPPAASNSDPGSDFEAIAEANRRKQERIRKERAKNNTTTLRFYNIRY